ncbi:MAG: hypothetical protein QXO67_04000 [Candidatus Bathyarchaeia archaeon]
MIRLLGAIAAGIFDGAIEMVYHSNPAQYEGKFPFMETIKPLPRVDDLLVFGVSGIVYGIGRFLKSKEFGEGMLLYSLPMLIVKIMATTGSMMATPTASPTVALPMPARWRRRTATQIVAASVSR